MRLVWVSLVGLCGLVVNRGVKLTVFLVGRIVHQRLLDLVVGDHDTGPLGFVLEADLKRGLFEGLAPHQLALEFDVFRTLVELFVEPVELFDLLGEHVALDEIHGNPIVGPETDRRLFIDLRNHGRSDERDNNDDQNHG